MNKLFLCLFLLIGCSLSPSKENENTKQDNSSQTRTEITNDSKYLDDYIIKQVIENYKDTTSRMETENSDSSLSIVWYSIPVDESDYQGILQTIEFSKLKYDHIFGDINNDGIQDLVATVNAGGGGSAAWNELFVFLSKDDKYTLSNVTRASEICGCTTGDFYPEKIEDGLILGKSICWAENDAHCCPSLKYLTTVAIESDKLKFKFKKQTK